MVANPTRILVPTDFSPTADAALAYAKTLATRLGASLHLVHVMTDPYVMSLYASDVYAPVSEGTYECMVADAHERLRQRLDAEEELRFGGSRAVRTGLAAKEIVSYAGEHDIDLIVMGTHGRRGVAHLILGSVAEQVVRTSRCPVLTVRYANIDVARPATEPAARAAA